MAAENGACEGKKKLATRAKELGLDAIHDTVHEMCKDEARPRLRLPRACSTAISSNGINIKAAGFPPLLFVYPGPAEEPMERNPEREESPLAKKAKLPDGPPERVEAQNEGIRPESNHHAANQNQHHNVKKEALGPTPGAEKRRPPVWHTPTRK